jgi:hypothetical protein
LGALDAGAATGTHSAAFGLYWTKFWFCMAAGLPKQGRRQRGAAICNVRACVVGRASNDEPADIEKRKEKTFSDEKPNTLFTSSSIDYYFDHQLHPFIINNTTQPTTTP